MKNLNKRDGFSFFNSVYKSTLKLNDEQYVQFMRKFTEVQFLESKWEDVVFEDELVDMMWTNMINTVESQINGYLVNVKKNPSQFMGVYDNSNPPLDPPSSTPFSNSKNEVQEKEQVEEQVEEQYSHPLLKELFKDVDYHEKIEEYVLDFINYRKQIRKALKTILPVKQYLNSLRALQQKGEDVDRCILVMKESEWLTLKVEYILNSKSANNSYNTSQDEVTNKVLERY